jgi:hypothetical protein
LPTEFTIAQVPVGQSVGDLTIDLTGDYGQCTYRTPLVDLGADFIEFTFTKIAGGPGCVATYPQAHELRRIGDSADQAGQHDVRHALSIVRTASAR